MSRQDIITLFKQTHSKYILIVVTTMNMKVAMTVRGATELHELENGRNSRSLGILGGAIASSCPILELSVVC